MSNMPRLLHPRPLGAVGGGLGRRGLASVFAPDPPAPLRVVSDRIRS